MSLSAQQAAMMREGLLAKLENENKAMIAVVEHVHEDRLDYKPHDKIRSFSEMVLHIYNTGVWFTDVLAKGKVEFPEGKEKPVAPTDKVALLDMCRQKNQEIANKVIEVSPEDLAKDVPFADFGSYPAISYLDWHLVHLIHHRGQLTMYLRLMGAKVPAIYGDSLDYPLNM